MLRFCGVVEGGGAGRKEGRDETQLHFHGVSDVFIALQDVYGCLGDFSKIFRIKASFLWTRVRRAVERVGDRSEKQYRMTTGGTLHEHVT